MRFTFAMSPASVGVWGMVGVLVTAVHSLETCKCLILILIVLIYNGYQMWHCCVADGGGGPN